MRVRAGRWPVLEGGLVMSTYFRILSIDGGGIRGIIPGEILVHVEEKLCDASGRKDARLSDFFDLIAGTSTGGILTCVYRCPDRVGSDRPRFSAQDAVNLYLERGGDIFDVPLWHRVRSGGGLTDEKYPATALERALEEYLGDLKLSELLGPCLITAYDIRRRETVFFTQHDAVRRAGKDFKVRDVARATSAAPTYFETARIHSELEIPYPLIDGGVFANNPALCAYAEARTMEGNPTASKMVVLSLGTGQTKRRFLYEDAKDWGMAGWIRPLIDILMSGVSETVDYQLRQMFDAVNAPEQYLRIDPMLAEPVSPEMDDASPDNLFELRALGTETADRHEAELDRFAELLTS
jgi:patatin-like phospholipase/acyl hydrolase